jgi:FixJ family two-component response regulator
LSKVPIISVIDDDESVRIAMKSLLSSIGMIVHLFESAEDFLQSAYVSDTACLITDIQMAGMSGIELHRTLIAQGQHMPKIFITAVLEESIRPRLLETGAVCLLCKPFDEQALLQCLDTALKRNKDEDVMQ